MRLIALLVAGAHALAKPPAVIGQKLHDVATPALLLDADAFERNCETLRSALALTGVRARPHMKAHKSGALAKRQLELLDVHASGVCAQTVSELEAAVDAGISDVLLTNEVVGADKIERVAAAAKKSSGRVGVLIDDFWAQATDLNLALDDDVIVDAYVEVDVGQRRCGVSPCEAAPLALQISRLKNLRFAGCHCYHGLLQHVPSSKERRAAVADVASAVREVREALIAAGLGEFIITGGGTGTLAADRDSGVFDEVQPGSFCVMDLQYGNIEHEIAFERALEVLTTIISRPSPHRCVVDAGSKAVDLVAGPPHAEGNRTYRSGGDEHGILDLAEGDDLPVGAKLRLYPSHCDPCVNLHDHWVVHRGGVVVEVLAVDARGSGC